MPSARHGTGWRSVQVTSRETPAHPTPRTSAMERALLGIVPALARSLPWIELGELPTRVERLDALSAAVGRAGADLYVKRDDRSAIAYGGNKVRTLGVLFGEPRAQG